jgi:hypothetical protein
MPQRQRAAHQNPDREKIRGESENAVHGAFYSGRWTELTELSEFKTRLLTASLILSLFPPMPDRKSFPVAKLGKRK